MQLRSVVFAIAAWLAVAGAPAAAGVVETPGSANFAAPRYVPNYFSNESAPFQGGVAARPGQPGPVPTFAVPTPRGYSSRYAAPSRRYAVNQHHVTARGRHHAGRRATGHHHRVAHVSSRNYHAAASRRGSVHAGSRRLARAGR